MRITWNRFVLVESNESAVTLNQLSRLPMRTLQTGWHFLQFNEVIIGPFQRIEPALEMTSAQVFSADGIPHTVRWVLSYGLYPEELIASMSSQTAGMRLAWFALGNLGRVARAQADECLRHIINKVHSDRLGNIVDRDQLQQQVVRRLHDRLTSTGFHVHDLLISEISPPAEVIQSRENVQRDRLRAQGRMAAQEEYSVLNTHSLQRLMLHDYLEVLLKHGYPPVYMIPSQYGTTLPGFGNGAIALRQGETGDIGNGSATLTDDVGSSQQRVDSHRNESG